MKHMCVTDRHDMTLAVKVPLNPNTTNQPIKHPFTRALLNCNSFSHQKAFDEEDFQKMHGALCENIYIFRLCQSKALAFPLNKPGS